MLPLTVSYINSVYSKLHFCITMEYFWRTGHDIAKHHNKNFTRALEKTNNTAINHLSFNPRGDQWAEFGPDNQ